MGITTVIWGIICICLTYFIISKLGIIEKWKEERRISNQKIKEAKETIRLIDEELKRRENQKSK
ncbi:hypothetical protein HN014_22490 (plasmid) [Aquimarina sp. TRL1]|uniref:hypothetical protein n=1 Tax=Aquimarina sp. (strain TRL1) TaxID=2736252 RepID=UPI0015893F36|nr:hypothetical protein [Aquimarina sp. TRL1]QKX07771.1 hypothetical protein HN014_22490 [Aquimarina sp. TRL1]